MADNNTKVEKTEKPVEAAKSDTKAADAKPADKKPDTKPSDTKSSDTKSSSKPKNDIMGDGTDDGDLILENERVSIPLTPANAKFSRSGGGLITLDITNDKGEPEHFERVVILRSFPVTNPNEFLSVREPDSKKQGRGKEIGMIRHMSDFDEETQKLFMEELDRRYFTPELQKITSVKDKFGYLYWDVVTTAGHVTFVLNNPFSNIRILEDGRILINDIDGNVFQISDPKKLDPASLKKIEIYL